MINVPPASFSAELVAIMKSALDAAVDPVDPSHRTPATKAKMAQRVVLTASAGIIRKSREPMPRPAKRPLGASLGTERKTQYLLLMISI